MTYTARRRTSQRHSAQVYATIGLETKVLGASPEQLITLLFDGALAAISKARFHMDGNNVEGRGMAISKAINIVDSGLKASVDREAGGELADNLIATYDQVIRFLLLANLNVDAQRLTLAERLLSTISQAWRTSVDPARPEAAVP